MEGLMLKLKLQYFDHLMWRADSFEKTLMLGKIEVRRRREQQRIRWLEGITDSIDMGLVELRQLVLDRETWCAVVHGVAKSWTGVSDWTELNCTPFARVLFFLFVMQTLVKFPYCFWFICLSSEEEKTLLSWGLLMESAVFLLNPLSVCVTAFRTHLVPQLEDLLGCTIS